MLQMHLPQLRQFCRASGKQTGRSTRCCPQAQVYQQAGEIDTAIEIFTAVCRADEQIGSHADAADVLVRLAAFIAARRSTDEQPMPMDRLPHAGRRLEKMSSRSTRLLAHVANDEEYGSPAMGRRCLRDHSGPAPPARPYGRGGRAAGTTGFLPRPGGVCRRR